MLGPARFRFLNEEREVAAPADWNAPGASRLWLYNLHYFDDLNAQDAAARRDWHAALIERWIAENPPGRGAGWEPFPTALRIVNWIKWALCGGDLSAAALDSLAVQARWLARRLETHLLGNHLFADAEALVFAGLFFRGPEADRWLAKGLALLRREVPEQILPDGGHVERSPMYHALVLEGLLDLVNLVRLYGGGESGECGGLLPAWEEAARRMLGWLSVMCHPDGEIALFNDAAFGVGPPPREIGRYAARLGLAGSGPAASFGGNGLTVLGDSGYVRVEHGGAVALLDAAPLGADHLVGHGHADTLSFEVSLDGERLIVDTGTSTYEEGARRLFERGTAAHNTVVVDGADSSEVWKSFRVARRARPFGLRVEEANGSIVVECAHDGYLRLPGRVIHRRRWVFGRGRLRVEDTLEGSFREARAGFLLHPSVAGASGDLAAAAPSDGGLLRLPGGRTLSWRAEGGRGRFEAASYHPRFGTSLATVRLVLPFLGPRAAFEIAWA